MRERLKKRYKLIQEKVERWYNGKLVQPINPNFDRDFIVFPPYIEYHWTARIARDVVAFYGRKWEWIWSTLIALASLWAAVAALKP